MQSTRCQWPLVTPRETHLTRRNRQTYKWRNSVFVCAPRLCFRRPVVHLPLLQILSRGRSVELHLRVGFYSQFLKNWLRIVLRIVRKSLLHNTRIVSDMFPIRYGMLVIDAVYRLVIRLVSFLCRYAYHIGLTTRVSSQTGADTPKQPLQQTISFIPVSLHLPKKNYRFFLYHFFPPAGTAGLCCVVSQRTPIRVSGQT